MKARAESTFFNGKTIGRQLREVSVDIVETEIQNIVSRWFHADPDVDLFAWLDIRQNVIKQQICFNGQVVEWNCIEGVKTGFVVETDSGSSSKDSSQPLVSETVRFDGVPQSSSVSLALEILSYIEEMEPLLHSQLVTNFQNPQTIKTMDPASFIRRYAPASEKSPEGDSGVFNNLLKKLRGR